MKLIKLLVAVLLSALVFAGCSSGASSDTKADKKTATSTTAVAPDDEVAAVAAVVEDYFYQLAMGLEPFMNKYASDSESDMALEKSDMDSMFAGALEHMDMDSFEDEKHAYGMLTASAGNVMMMTMEPSTASTIPELDDPGFEKEFKKALGIKFTDKVTVSGDTATAPAQSFLSAPPTTEGYVDELGEIREGFNLQLVRKNGTWLIDGSAIDDAYFQAIGVNLNDLTIK